MNSTLAADDDEAHVVGWIVLPVLVGSMLYFALSLMVWPYARPMFPFWILFALLLFPPFFPFVVLYLLYFYCLVGPLVPIATPVIVTAQPARGSIIVVDSGTRGRPRAVTFASGRV